MRYTRVSGATLFRRDRLRRQRGGVAIFMRECLRGQLYEPTNMTNRDLEILWVRFLVAGRVCYLAGIYHPPTPIYREEDFIATLELTLAEIEEKDPGALIIAAGDFNRLEDHKVQALGLAADALLPTHDGNCLDRVYTSEPSYTNIKALESAITTDHKALVCTRDTRDVNLPGLLKEKISVTKQYRRRSPSQHARLFDLLKECTWEEVLYCSDVQTAFDNMYFKLHFLLDSIYPLRNVAVTNREPSFVTPYIKAQLRLKNKLMHRGKLEAAEAIGRFIRGSITRSNTKILGKESCPSRGTKALWDRVREITGSSGRKSTLPTTIELAEELNTHFAQISTDMQYQQPAKRLIGENTNQLDCVITEEEIFHMLDRLKCTSMGLDNLPAWFLRVSAPYIALPIAYLFSLSLSHSILPSQWRDSAITPVPKVSCPCGSADYRPISVTPILSSILERIVVRKYIYPIFSHSNYSVLFDDQFAFRPTGSTTAALIFLWHKVSILLQSHPYVHVIALDFSKAFDTVRHHTLINKLAQFPLPPNIHNWIIDYLRDRRHCTKYSEGLSQLLAINASIIQGSGMGPGLYDVNSSDLKANKGGNELCKYADDTYLIVPSSNSHTVQTELDHIASWASCNNLKLNKSKTLEIIIRRPRVPVKSIDSPPIVTGIQRVETLLILGVTVGSNFNFSQHIRRLEGQTGQVMYAIRLLKSRGLSGQSLWDVTKATLISRLTYALPFWWGFLDCAEKKKTGANN